MSTASSLADRHSKVRRTTGNLARWEARYGVDITQDIKFQGGLYVITTDARMHFHYGEGDALRYADLAIERVACSRSDPETIAIGEREEARADLAGKFNNWVQVQDEFAAMAEYLDSEGGES